MADKNANQIPAAALILGAAGLLPFIALAVGVHVLQGDRAILAPWWLAAYGAVILSFLGGVQWGLAAAANQHLAIRLTVSIMPSLIAWMALLVPRQMGFHVLAVAFALTLYIDWKNHREGQSPPWYIRLRLPLSVIVILSLLAAAAA